MWMVRAGKGARYFKNFKELNIISIEWDFDDLSNKSTDEIRYNVKKSSPKLDEVTVGIFTSQIVSFVSNFKIGDYVITYNPNNRLYLIGKVCSDYYYSEEFDSLKLKHFRNVEWLCKVRRDQFKGSILKTLNTSSIVFQINSNVQRNILETINNLDNGLFIDDIDGEINGETSGIGDGDVKKTQYWLHSPGPGAGWWDEFYDNSEMGLGFDEIGDLSRYNSQEEIKLKFKQIHGNNSFYIGNANTCWQFIHDMQIGDVVFARRGRNEIIGKGVVESEYEYDESNDNYHKIRKINWTHNGVWNYDLGKLASKILKDITSLQEEVDNINALFDDDENVGDNRDFEYPTYSADKFLDEVYINEDDYETLVNLLKNKKNLIVQGAPGVGKTFMAKRLAYSIMGVKDTNRVMMVQFHQSYSYEDFVMGFRPAKNGFELKHGSFYEFCKKAEEDSDNSYFFIIDEINRGNLSKIFGELFMLIENDKRGDKNRIRLLYSNEFFFIPKNVHLIGLMNTADRSLAMIDYALRRRFAFFDLKPGFDTEGFRNYQENLESSKFNSLIETMKELNQEIENDESLGEGFRIGHSYLCNIKEEDIDEKLDYIVEYELIPLLKEYWFDDSEKIENWSFKLRSAINDL